MSLNTFEDQLQTQHTNQFGLINTGEMDDILCYYNDPLIIPRTVLPDAAGAGPIRNSPDFQVRTLEANSNLSLRFFNLVDLDHDAIPVNELTRLQANAKRIFRCQNNGVFFSDRNEILQCFAYESLLLYAKRMILSREDIYQPLLLQVIEYELIDISKRKAKLVGELFTILPHNSINVPAVADSRFFLNTKFGANRERDGGPKADQFTNEIYFSDVSKTKDNGEKEKYSRNKYVKNTISQNPDGNFTEDYGIGDHEFDAQRPNHLVKNDWLYNIINTYLYLPEITQRGVRLTPSEHLYSANFDPLDEFSRICLCHYLLLMFFICKENETSLGDQTPPFAQMAGTFPAALPRIVSMQRCIDLFILVVSFRNLNKRKLPEGNMFQDNLFRVYCQKYLYFDDLRSPHLPNDNNYYTVTRGRDRRDPNEQTSMKQLVEMINKTNERSQLLAIYTDMTEFILRKSLSVLDTDGRTVRPLPTQRARVIALYNITETYITDTTHPILECKQHITNNAVGAATYNGIYWAFRNDAYAAP